MGDTRFGTVWDLQWFADGASGGDGGDAGSRESGESPQDAAGAAPSDPGAGEKMSFEELMKDPEYKAAFDARFKKGLDGRFRNLRALQERQAQLAPMLERLCGQYGLPYSPDMDPKDLVAAVTGEARQTPSREERWNGVLRQAEAAKVNFPELDLEKELRDPAFGRMVAGGVPVEQAYQAVHLREILTQGMRYAARQARQQTVNSIASGRNRPRENGMGGKTAAPQFTTDPRSLTREQREDIIARARRGEKITF